MKTASLYPRQDAQEKKPLQVTGELGWKMELPSVTEIRRVCCWPDGRRPGWDQRIEVWPPVGRLYPQVD